MSVLMDQTWKLNKSVGCDAKCSSSISLPHPHIHITHFHPSCLPHCLYHFRINLVMAKWDKNGNGNTTPTASPNNNDIINMCIEIYLRNLIMIRVNTIVWVCLYVCVCACVRIVGVRMNESDWTVIRTFAPVYNIIFGVWFNPNRK